MNLRCSLCGLRQRAGAVLFSVEHRDGLNRTHNEMQKAANNGHCSNDINARSLTRELQPDTKFCVLKLHLWHHCVEIIGETTRTTLGQCRERTNIRKRRFGVTRPVRRLISYAYRFHYHILIHYKSPVN